MKWIKVTERLPEMFKDVYVKTKLGFKRVTCIDSSGKWDNNPIRENDKIIEWLDESTPSTTERMFTLEEALEIWDASENFSNECFCGACDYCIEVSTEKSPDRYKYFKEKFGITLP
jgi:hypothetical protein